MLKKVDVDLSSPLDGFNEIRKYWDRPHEMVAAKILPGEYYVTNKDELITTVLGSCVSACVRDRVFGIGGMNHFMLPYSSGDVGWGGSSDLVSSTTRYGNYAMEHMINAILSNGGHRKNLEIKIFGGGRIIDTQTNIGLNNIKFIKQYIADEGLKYLGGDVGEIYPRKVIYFPKTGKVRLKKLKHLHNDTVVSREIAYQKEIQVQPVESSIELF